MISGYYFAISDGFPCSNRKMQFAEKAQEGINLLPNKRDNKLIVPDSVLAEILWRIHQQFHYGRRETVFHFNAHFYAKNVNKVAAEVCSACDCYAAKATRKGIDPISSLKADSLPFAEVCFFTL